MTLGARFAVVAGAFVLAACGAEGGEGRGRDDGEGGGPQTPTVGAAFPDYAAPTLERDTVSLRDYRGEVVLLNVWATWCPACRREMPSLQALHEELGPDGLRVVGVSIDGAGEESAIRDFLEEVGATYTILHDPQGQLLEQAGFRIIGVPTTYLADRRGRLVERWIGEVDFADAEIRGPIEETLSAGEEAG